MFNLLSLSSWDPWLVLVPISPRLPKYHLGLFCCWLKGLGFFMFRAGSAE